MALDYLSFSNRFMRRFINIALSACLIWPYSAQAWWETGHRTVARIAVAHLTPAASTRVARVLEVADTAEEIDAALVRSVTWPDEIAKETHTGPWHYIDLALQDRKSAIPERCPDEDCAPARIRLFAEQLAGHPAHPDNTRWSQREALLYVVHFVGDIHQPLHAVSDADLGGNCEQLEPPVGKAKNLHALWDGGIIEEMSSSDETLAHELDSEIAEMSPHRVRVLSEGDPDDWAWESHELAMRDIYHRLHIPIEPVEFPKSCAEAPAQITELRLDIPASYISEMKPVIREQLIKAGLRLARLLNESL